MSERSLTINESNDTTNGRSLILVTLSGRKTPQLEQRRRPAQIQEQRIRKREAEEDSELPKRSPNCLQEPIELEQDSKATSEKEDDFQPQHLDQRPIRQNRDSRIPFPHHIEDRFRGNHQQEFKMKADLPTFSGKLDVEELLDWIKNVESFFKYMDTPED